MRGSAGPRRAPPCSFPIISPPKQTVVRLSNQHYYSLIAQNSNAGVRFARVGTDTRFQAFGAPVDADDAETQVSDGHSYEWALPERCLEG
jgi:hypothetical protein